MNKDNPSELQSYRRQFSITKSPEWLQGWKCYRSLNRFVHAGPDMEVTQSDDLQVTLIGYAIDPENPSATNWDIVNRISQLGSYSALKTASQLGGRWVLLCELQDKEFVMHDACGLRQVFYSEDFCASQTTSAAKFYGLKIDEEAKCGFRETSFVRTNDEYWWPGDSTQYKGIKCLLPNHYLDLKTSTAHRYGLEPLNNYPDSAERCAKILVSLITGAARRFELSLPLTAGWDSRTILAGCLKAGVEPYCYTLKWGSRTMLHQDLRIPPQLIASTHHIIECPEAATEEFDKAFRESVNPAHDSSIAMGLWNEYPQTKVSLSGHCSEVARCFYQDRNAEVTAEYLAEITGMDKTTFVLKQFETWLSNAKMESDRCGIHILDLFYWEQRAGRWAANGQAQWDIIHERFTPFNQRTLIFSLLSVPENFRKSPDYLLYRNMIEIMAPKLLEVPINPDSTKKRDTVFRKALHRIKSLVS